MNNLFYILDLLTVCVIICIKQIHCGCNERILIEPCLCYGQLIDCNNRYDNGYSRELDVVFGKLSKLLNDTHKTFESVIIDNLNITSLNANTVKDLVFKEKIIIQFNSRLETIDDNAFNGTDSVTTSIVIQYNPRLGLVFNLLKRFSNVRDITISNNNITQIPNNALDSKQDKLSYISIAETLKRIGSRAFSKLVNLNHLKIINYKLEDNLDNIDGQAFAFDQASNITFYLDIDEGNWNLSKALNNKSLSGINRPTLLSLTSLRILPETIFSPFLSEDKRNEIQIKMKTLDCSDCRNGWIKKNEDFVARLNSPCSNGLVLDSVGNFKGC